MSLIQIVFSPTGGTQKTVDAMSAAFGMPITKIDLSSSKESGVSIGKDDIVLIAMPSYGGRVPAIAAERLLKRKGNGAACVLVCVYGNRAYEDTLVEMQDLAEQSGFRVFAAVASIAEHSIMHQYASGRPDPQDAQELRNFTDQIRKRYSLAANRSHKMPFLGTAPTKSPAGSVWFPKRTKAAQNAGPALMPVPRRQSIKMPV